MFCYIALIIHERHHMIDVCACNCNHDVANLLIIGISCISVACVNAHQVASWLAS